MAANTMGNSECHSERTQQQKARPFTAAASRLSRDNHPLQPHQ